MRSHPRALPAIDRLFDVFGDATIGTDAAKAFGDIAAADGVFTKRHAAVVRVRLRLRCAMCEKRGLIFCLWTQFLWAQKFATGMLPRLMGGARDESGASIDFI